MVTCSREFGGSMGKDGLGGDDGCDKTYRTMREVKVTRENLLELLKDNLSIGLNTEGNVCGDLYLTVELWFGGVKICQDKIDANYLRE